MIRVCIDPGHGGEDRKNRGPTSYIEADGMLQLSYYLKEELEKTKAFNVKMTRETDKTVTLSQRAAIAREHRARIFLSQHSNAGGGTGPEVFFSLRQQENRFLAEKISSSIAKATGRRDRGAKTRESSTRPGYDYYTVISRAVEYQIPYVFIIENLFHDHPEEEKILLSSEGLKTIARAQKDALCWYFNVQPQDYLKTELEEIHQQLAGLTVQIASLERSAEEAEKIAVSGHLRMLKTYATQIEKRVFRLLEEIKEDK